MDPKTLSTILGHYSVAFTLDTYAHCLDEQKRKGMDLMETMYEPEEFPDIQNRNYPLIFTANQDGFIVTAPDFPKFSLACDKIDNGLQQAKVELQKIMNGYKYLPVPTKPEELGIPNGSFVVMLAA